MNVMAELVAAFGSSHSTMQFSSVEHWIEMFDHIDRKSPIHDFDGVARSFDELLAARPSDAALRISPDSMIRRHAEMQRAMNRLEADLAAARLDALVIVGDDQREIFRDDCRPALGVYYGQSIRNAAAPMPPPKDWYARDQHRRLEEAHDVFYPCDAGLATHFIEGLSARSFDVTAIKGLIGDQFEGHAYSFFHKRYLAKNLIPVIPIFLNTYYPPNQPTPQRCFDLGLAIRDLIQSYPEALRVGIAASGGLSHFLVNEPLDQMITEILRNGDVKRLTELPPRLLQSGSSEIRNWICVAAAAHGLKMRWLSYVPAYRSRALTGVGLGFASWS
jgi:hypothetical protein